MKRVVQCVNRFARVATPARAYFVEAIAFRVIANCQSERQRIFYDDRISADVRITANATKLMNP